MKKKKHKQEFAFFMERPRRLRDLLRPYADSERPYVIVKKVELRDIDYENFCEDMTVERDFLSGVKQSEEYPFAFECVLIRRKANPDDMPILVAPQDGGYVGWAAVYLEE